MEKGSSIWRWRWSVGARLGAIADVGVSTELQGRLRYCSALVTVTASPDLSSLLRCPVCRSSSCCVCRAFPDLGIFQLLEGRLDLVLKFPVKEGAVDFASVPIGPPLSGKDTLP